MCHERTVSLHHFAENVRYAVGNVCFWDNLETAAEVWVVWGVCMREVLEVGA